jgi:uncharacterized LabA/DUF88 family protein
MGNVAVYWDFENIHASLCDNRFGENWYKHNRHQNQPAVIDIDCIMEFVATLGSVNINKAYGNWAFFGAYNFQLQSYAVDLLQLFPRGGHAKNGADIRMAIDIMEDLTQNPHISIIVVLGGDSDYISVAQRVRQKGRRIVGIGVQESTNQYWIRACNEFKFYASLLVKASAPQEEEIGGAETESIEEAKNLLCRAILALGSQIGGGAVLKAAIKPMMTRFDSSFDEANFGFKTFTDFLKACQDVITISHGKHDHLVELKVSAGPTCTPQEPQPPGLYHHILKRQKADVVDPSLMEIGASETIGIFADNKGQIPSYAAFREELAKRLRVRGILNPEANARDFKNMLFKSWVFKRDLDNTRISLVNDFKTGTDLLLYLRQYVVKRILDNIQGPPDVAELSAILYGDGSHIQETNELIQEYNKVS